MIFGWGGGEAYDLWWGVGGGQVHDVVHGLVEPY